MDIKVKALGKDVSVSMPDGIDAKAAFNEASAYVRGLETRHEIRDLSAGVNPPRATHEIVKDDTAGGWRLKRFRMSGCW